MFGKDVRAASSSLSFGRASFTLIELLIVIAVVAILSVVVVLVLNPTELLKQARDSNRIADMQTLNKALILYQGDRGGSLGTASTTYFSLVDLAATSTSGTDCASLGLSAPTGWSFHCAASSTARKLDGTGWIPLNFSAITFSPPFGALPLDPTNTSSSGLYYAYIPGTSTYAITAGLQSEKYLAAKGNGDGGVDPSRLETGSNLSLVSAGEGLVGWWKFDEESGTSAANSSGATTVGTLTGGATWTAGKMGNAVSFDGVDDYVSIATDFFSGTYHGPSSLLMWVKASSLPTSTRRIFSDNCFEWGMSISNAGSLTGAAYVTPTGFTISTGQWYQAALTHEHPSGTTNTVIKFYVNGELKGQTTWTFSTENGYNDAPYFVGSDTCNAGMWFNGAVDDLRVYKRGLSAAEVAAIYNAQK